MEVEVQGQRGEGEPLTALIEAQWDGARALAQRWSSTRQLEVGGLWGSSQAFVLAQLERESRELEGRDPAGPWVIVVSSESEAELLVDDLELFGLRAARFPARESAGQGDVSVIRARLEMTQRLAGPPDARPQVLVSSILALLQPVPTLKELEKEFLGLRVEQVLQVEHLLKHLVAVGYQRQPLAESPGEVSLRGEILDLYPFASEFPLRIELFDDEIESLRLFDPADQRSISSHQEIELCLAADQGEGGAQLAELFGADARWIELEPLRVEERAEALRIRSPVHERALRRLHELWKKSRRLVLQSLPAGKHDVDTRSTQALEVGFREAPGALLEATADGTQAWICCPGQVESERFEAELKKAGLAERVRLVPGNLSKGFRLPAAGFLCISLRELKGLVGLRRRSKQRSTHKSHAIQSFFELKKGDLVVHAVHGLASYRGLQRMERAGGEEEHLHLEFAGGVSLFVPASRVDMVQRYIGSGHGVTLDKIGATSFRKRKEKVERGLYDLAAEMIEVQAQRELRARPAWAPDEELVAQMIASFPYEDTVDQVTVDSELAADLAGKRPMDRLICGDVGFGKTELAIRAAFRVVAGGGQVAVLVPTTVLAEQHYKNFQERLSAFPVEVRVVSRYVENKEVREAVRAVNAGEVDVLIGTHRLLSKDVQFHKLGLVIVDEEQRFGVTHKEHFKKLRASVDVLTLTATPIPRTLHMSLSGIRDISALTVPPPGRQSIETVIAFADEQERIREILLREFGRGGQVYFLHNRVSSIGAVARRLQTLVPECTYAVGHGQMAATELRQVMEAFTRGDADVLIATTIIENGIDVPAAGTILIDDADHFGLSELHQLRGRVGRGSQKAHCYLLVERHKPLKDIARQRLKALEEMNQLGAGFGISVKDLELRGAGNILGAQQSGHIAAVGYDMYCRLLKQTIEHVRAGEQVGEDWVRAEEYEAGVELELGLRAFLPDSWIPDPDTRLELMRELVQIASKEDSEREEGMLKDRFGRLPVEVHALLRMLRLKPKLDPHGIRRLAWREGVYLIEYEDPVALERLFGTQRVDLRRIRRGLAHLVVPERHATPEAALSWFETLLEGRA